jgi:hypothetical protein
VNALMKYSGKGILNTSFVIKSFYTSVFIGENEKIKNKNPPGCAEGSFIWMG